MWHIHRVEYYSAANGEILPFAETWMDLESGYYANQTGKKRKEPYDFTQM